MKHIKWMPILMALTILGIAAFQLYWIRKAYEREQRTMEIRSNMAFRESIYSLQASKLNLDKLIIESESGDLPRGAKGSHTGPAVQFRVGASAQKASRIVTELQQKISDSMEKGKKVYVVGTLKGDSMPPARVMMRNQNRLMKILYDVENVQDTITIAEISKQLRKHLDQQNMDIPFTIIRTVGKREDERVFNQVSVGFKNPITYKLQLGNTFPYLLRKIAAPILLSVFLIAFTVVSFLVLYRNLLRQRRLAEIKNEFISNITHELKTPIATVSVAIEALRSFNASMDPQKTKEYLDISANELQRLSLLVDKVLKLSMFEKTEVDLKYEPLDMKALVDEVTSSMRLQFEKHHADVRVTTEGDTRLEGDRLHLVSVIFNLLDNALKYGNGHPEINVNINGGQSKLSLCIADNGIGVPPEYRDKIFEKFFRVPTGNVHNAKGYGLGLSYVSHVVNKHNGNIRVESVEGTGSRFVITLPKTAV
jgi:two-component system, OmpR family, phosphate regulon sensor histidine kinase PhoR